MQLQLWLLKSDSQSGEPSYWYKIVSRNYPRVPTRKEVIALDEGDIESGHNLIIKMVAWGNESTPHLFLGELDGIDPADLDFKEAVLEGVPIVLVDGISQLVEEGELSES